MDDELELKSSSFMNVTLAFWTNENGLAIAAHTLDDRQTHTQDSDAAKQSDQLAKPLAEAIQQTSKDVTFQKLISNLVSDQLSTLKNESSLKANDNMNGVLNDMTNLTKKLIDNMTDAINETLLCSSSDVSPNECIWRNDTRNGTDLVGSGRPERVYWALFLVILPILALFGNILVILR